MIRFLFSVTVIAIDIDPKKVEMAKHNARIYGVEERIDFIVGDFFEVVPKLAADVVFLSPPWGGPSYNRLKSFPLSDICPPHGGKSIYDVARRVTPNIAYYLPRNINSADVSFCYNFLFYSFKFLLHCILNAERVWFFVS